MHPKALELLRKWVLRVFCARTAKTCHRLSEKEMDMKDKLGPSITYLQRLGSEYLDTVFQYSKWILDENSEMGLEVSSVVYASYAAC